MAMERQILFIQGAGEGAFEEDKELAASLQQALGPDYRIHYPAMPDEDNASYDRWKHQIEQEWAQFSESVVLVGHSVGASILIKSFTELQVTQSIAGIFLLATPFWGGDGWLYLGYEELALPTDPASQLPPHAPLFLYHCRDDEIVPFAHLALYVNLLPQAIIRAIDAGGHQFSNDLSTVARDIEHLWP